MSGFVCASFIVKGKKINNGAALTSAAFVDGRSSQNDEREKYLLNRGRLHKKVLLSSVIRVPIYSYIYAHIISYNPPECLLISCHPSLLLSSCTQTIKAAFFRCFWPFFRPTPCLNLDAFASTIARREI